MSSNWFCRQLVYPALHNLLHHLRRNPICSFNVQNQKLKPRKNLFGLKGLEWREEKLHTVFWGEGQSSTKRKYWRQGYQLLPSFLTAWKLSQLWWFSSSVLRYSPPYWIQLEMETNRTLYLHYIPAKKKKKHVLMGLGLC